MENTEVEKIKIGSDVGMKVNCSMCQKEGTTDQFITLRGNKGQNVYLCPDCKVQANQAFEAETKDPNILRAILLGAVGALIGGVVWYAVAVAFELQIGYVALGLGYLVGLGVYIGAGRKRGRQLQIISVILVIIAIVVAKKFTFDYFANDYIQHHLSEFPNFAPGQTVSISIFSSVFWETMVTPIGLLIYAFGVYIAYKFCKPRRIL